MAGAPPPGGGGREVSAEGYLLYSSQVLASLDRPDPAPPAFADGTSSSIVQRANADVLARTREHFSGAALPPPPSRAPAPPALGGQTLDRSAQQAYTDALARVREQFSGAAMLPPPSAALSPPPPPSAAPQSQERIHGSDLMNMSIGNISIQQLLEARGGDLNRAQNDLVRLSTLRLQWEQAETEAHVDREVSVQSVAFNDGHTSPHDRVSELRYTDMSMNSSDHRSIAPTDFTEARNSLMEASIMSFGTEDMSFRGTLEENQRQSISTEGSNERETANLLMRLSTDSKHRNSE